MRIVLFFDLPTITLKDQRNYRIFVKQIKKIGFYMIQESVYVKLCLDRQVLNGIMIKLEGIKPKSGSIFVFTMTEKQFSQMKILTGENTSDVINSTDRTVIL